MEPRWRLGSCGTCGSCGMCGWGVRQLCCIALGASQMSSTSKHCAPATTTKTTMSSKKVKHQPTSQLAKQPNSCGLQLLPDLPRFSACLAKGIGPEICWLPVGSWHSGNVMGRRQVSVMSGLHIGASLESFAAFPEPHASPPAIFMAACINLCYSTINDWQWACPSDLVG